MQSIIDAIEQWLKDFLIGAITGNLSSMFSDVNSKVATIATEVGKTPESWNSSVFSIILTLCVQRSWTTLAGVSPVTVIASEPCS